jgi:hypothetical protein
MGPFPFIRFPEPVLNAGFYPESNRVSELLDRFLFPFTNNDYVGDSWTVAINAYKFFIATLNEPFLNAGFVLVLPNPFPVITGTQTLTLYVRNLQLFATNSTQEVLITLNLTSGVVTSNFYNFVGAITESGNLDAPILAIEKEIKKTLEVYQQNGAAIFNHYYKWDRTTETATSGLIRAKDWALSSAGANRTPLPTNPFQANDWILVEELTGESRYILTLFGQIVNFAFDPTKAIININDFVSVSLDFPPGFSVVIADNGTDFIEISIYGPSSGFKLIGHYDSSWTWQRFYTDQTPTPITFITYGSFSGQWPFLPNSGRFFVSQWYDVEDLSFIDSDPENVDTYTQPIKSGDQLQFNIVPEISNITDLTGCEIAIFDCDGVFIQKIGEATLPSCKLNITFQVFFPNNFEFEIEESGSSINWTYVDSNGDVTRDLFFIFYYQLGFGGEFWSSIIALFNAAFPLWTITYEAADEGDFLYFTVDNVECCVQGIGYNTNFSVWPTPGSFENPNPACGCATQLQAAVTIPYLPDGNYYLGLYNSSGYINEVFAFSNTLALDNSETFSTIWQYGSSENAIIEGFEYYDGWMQRLRLPINGGGQKPKIEESIYRNSDGTYQRPSNYSDLTVDLHSDYLDLETRNAVASATRCPILIFEGQSIFVSGDLDVATVQDFSNKTSFRKLAQMKFSALIQGFQPENNNCIGC